MSLLGTLEQFNLAHVLQRLETHAKSGLILIKQGEQWVELYFRQGQLLCMSTVRKNATLEDRLVQAGVISPQARQEALLAIDSAEPGETRTVLTLLEMGFVSREALRAWATQEATQVLQLLLTWSTGEMYFEEDVIPPNGRLLVALSVTSLLATLPSQPSVSQPVQAGITAAPTQMMQAMSDPVTHAPDAAESQSSFSTSQLLSGSMPKPRVTSLISSREIIQPSDMASAPVAAPATGTLTLPQPIANPTAPRCIDTSFMRPEMVLMPMDLTSLRERNPQLQFTPEQWRLFALVDGRTSLQMACQALGCAPELVCQLAGELIALGLVYIPTPVLQPAPVNLMTVGVSNGYMTPGYAAATAQPWAPIPTTGTIPFPAPAPVAPEPRRRYQSVLAARFGIPALAQAVGVR